MKPIILAGAMLARATDAKGGILGHKRPSSIPRL